MTVGTFSIPLALALGWLTLRGIFDLMPGVKHAHAPEAAHR
jgi:hypothetical protein